MKTLKVNKWVRYYLYCLKLKQVEFLQFLVSYTKTEAEKTKSLTTYYTLARSKPISKVMILSIITSTAN